LADQVCFAKEVESETGTTMSGPADERIKRFLEKRAANAESAAAENAAQQRREAEKRETFARWVRKWTGDSRLIVAILEELKTKLSDTRFFANFQAKAPHLDAIATAVIVGSFDSRQIDLTLSVLYDGFIHILRNEGDAISYGVKTNVQVLTANKDEYEAIILDALGID
jgi:hypothetical protein